MTAKFAVYHVNRNKIIKIRNNMTMYGSDRITYDSLEGACASIIATHVPNKYNHHMIWKDENGTDVREGGGIVITTASEKHYYQDDDTNEIFRIDKDGIIDRSKTYNFFKLE